ACPFRCHTLKRQHRYRGAAMTRTDARVFRAADRVLQPAVTETGTTRIAREIGASISRHMGAGLEVLENVVIDWTVTYDEVLFIHSGRLTVEFNGESHDCLPGDIV